jgi:hypothetical protein
MGISRGTVYRLMTQDGSWSDFHIESAAFALSVEVIDLIAPDEVLDRLKGQPVEPAEVPITTDSTRRLLELASLQLEELRAIRADAKAREEQ